MNFSRMKVNNLSNENENIKVQFFEFTKTNILDNIKKNYCSCKNTRIRKNMKMK